jgi:hypothetical protein
MEKKITAGAAKMSRNTLIAAFVACILLFTACSSSSSSRAGYESASRVTTNDTTSSSQNTTNYSAYENVDIFSEAKNMGYTVEERRVTDLPDYSYYVLFGYNGHTIAVSGKKESYGLAIFFYENAPDELNLEMGVFAVIGVPYSDNTSDFRNGEGHWTFSALHKKELLDLLRAYADEGIFAFRNQLKSTTLNDFKELADMYNLDIRYNKLGDAYNYYFFSPSGKLAYFYATYSEADFPPNEKASRLQKWTDADGQDIGVGNNNFGCEIVRGSVTELETTPERIEQLREFFE